MMTELARSPAVLALGAAVLHSVWQIAGVALVLAVLLRALSGAAASTRYALACAALVLSAVAPVATFVHLLPAAPAGEAIMLFGAAPPLPAPPPSALALTLLALAWGAGATFTTARFAFGLFRVRQLARSGRGPLAAEWQEKFAALARRLGLSRVPELLASPLVDVPVAIGFFRPVVLVPLSIFGSLPPASVEALLAHELAHLRRLDFAVNLVLSAVEAALFYHPAARWIAGVVRAEREHAADDLAAPLFGQKRYATALFELESIRGTVPEPALGSNGGSLMVRIRRLVTPRPQERARSRAAMVPVLGGLVLLGACAAAIGACERRPESDSPETSARAAAEVHIRWLPPALAPYRSAFSAAAAKHGVDADTLAIVALVESSGDPAAESPAGAVGLMQLMPKTAARIAQQRGLADFGQERLKDPAYNVDLGAYYFAQQLTAFGALHDDRRAVELASAAYNAGPNAVRAYLDGQKPLPEETERYKALVVGMWSERDGDRSQTFADWRARVEKRAEERSAPPLSGGTVTLRFGETWKGSAHQGIDLASPEGTQVASPLDGVVIEAGADGARGNVVVIRHGGGIETRYHHLGTVAVAPGQHVTQKSPIGTVGSTGESTGPHVHFEVRDLGSPIDPAPFLDTPAR